VLEWDERTNVVILTDEDDVETSRRYSFEGWRALIN